MFGSVTRKNICRPLAPSTRAASSSSVPVASITGMISRATNGNDTKTVARTMPGTANTILRPWSISHGPSRPCRPNSSTNTMPEITGDTANGRSISVVSRFLPRNSNFAMAHPAQTPNTRFARHRDRRGEQRQLQRRDRVRVRDRRGVGAPPLARSLGEDERQRQDQEERQEREHDGGESPAQPRRLRQVVGRVAAPRRIRSWHGSSHDAQFASWRPLQCWSALIARSSRNDIVSITSAIAVAPA